MMEQPQLSDALAGLVCTRVLRFDTTAWSFEFGDRTTLDVRCPWRIIVDGKVAFGNADPVVNGVSQSKNFLTRPITAVRVDEHTADITLEFEDSVSLEVFNSSSVYEGWECTSDNGLLAIGVGGGELQVLFTNPPTRYRR